MIVKIQLDRDLKVNKNIKKVLSIESVSYERLKEFFKDDVEYFDIKGYTYFFGVGSFEDNMYLFLDTERWYNYTSKFENGDVSSDIKNVIDSFIREKRIEELL